MAAGPRATMDFFAAQAAAKRRTAVLVVYFALAWLGTIALVYLGLGVFLRLEGIPEARALAFSPVLLAGTASLVTLVTAGGAAFHAARLSRGGGHAVAAMLGGVPVDRGTRDPDERRLVNVVEEMAIASGIPVPALYVLPQELGVNAFAAGFTPERSIVAVTQGALEELTRDELQGVVAHEFSHLLNSDARLNLRLVALVGGITVLALVGRALVRGGRVRVRGRGRGRGGSLLPLAGLLFWVAGSVGAFFGRLIRAAVSRQREFLADAAAVQFTRNPDGLAGALVKVAARGSSLVSAQAPEVSHLFFANGLASRWLATHPPIEERIRRISPHAPRARGAPAAPPLPVTPAAGISALAPAAAVPASAGRPEPRHVAWAHDLLGRLPEEVTAAAREPRGAAALALALLADADPVVRETQLRQVAPAARAEAERLAATLAGSAREDRMAILDLALPALDALPREGAAALVADLSALAGADGRTTVLEWALQRVVRRRLAPVLGEKAAVRTRARTIEDVQVEALELLSVLSWLGARDEAGVQAALDAGVAALGVRARWRPLPRDRVRAARLEAALARLEDAAPGLKERILAACAAAALSDRRVTAAEGEVIRAVAASLGVPVPPLVPEA